MSPSSRSSIRSVGLRACRPPVDRVLPPRGRRLGAEELFQRFVEELQELPHVMATCVPRSRSEPFGAVPRSGVMGGAAHRRVERCDAASGAKSSRFGVKALVVV